MQFPVHLRVRFVIVNCSYTEQLIRYEAILFQNLSVSEDKISAGAHNAAINGFAEKTFRIAK